MDLNLLKMVNDTFGHAGGIRSFLAIRLGLAVTEGGELSLGGGGVPP